MADEPTKDAAAEGTPDDGGTQADAQAPSMPTRDDLVAGIDPAASQDDIDAAVNATLRQLGAEAAGEGDDEGDEGEPEADATGGPAEGDPPPTDGGKAEPVAAPITWSPEDQALFKGMKPEAQKRIVEMVGEVEQRETAMRQAYAPMQRALEYWGPAAQSQGLDPVRLMEDGASLLYHMQTAPNGRKIRILQQLAADYDVQWAEDEIDPKQDPLGIHRANRAAIDPVRDEIAQLRAENDRREAAAAQAQRQRVAAEMAAFVQEKTPDGKALAHPYFAEVEPQMKMIAAGHRGTGQPIPPLKELYEQACQANPVTRERLRAAANAKAKAKRKAGRRASPGLAGGGTGGDAEPALKPMKDPNDFRATMRELMQRGAAQASA